MDRERVLIEAEPPADHHRSARLAVGTIFAASAADKSRTRADFLISRTSYLGKSIPHHPLALSDCETQSRKGRSTVTYTVRYVYYVL